MDDNSSTPPKKRWLSGAEKRRIRKEKGLPPLPSELARREIQKELRRVYREAHGLPDAPIRDAIATMSPDELLALAERQHRAEQGYQRTDKLRRWREAQKAKKLALDLPKTKQQKYWDANRERLSEKARAYRQQHKDHTRQVKQTKVDKLRTEVSLYKLALGCTDCGYRVHPSALDFDHLPGVEKLANVSSLVILGRRDATFAEIAKCEVVCANCHRIRTARRHEPTDNE